MGLRSPRAGDQLTLPLIAEAVAATAAEVDGVTATSRRDFPTLIPGRRVRLDREQRAAEETRFETALWSHLPPGKSLHVAFTENRYTMVSVRRAQAGYQVRLHHMFACADPRMMRALARYVVHNDQRASALIGEFIDENQHVIRQQPRRERRQALRPLGRFHDLQAIFDRLNARHFAGAIGARITWGQALRPKRQQRSIKMGSFSMEDRIIRIHPVLDRPGVPDYFVEWIVFHEMLHGKHGVVRTGQNGRRCFHSKEFLLEERAYPDFQRASAWERANIDRLLGG